MEDTQLLWTLPGIAQFVQQACTRGVSSRLLTIVECPPPPASLAISLANQARTKPRGSLANEHNSLPLQSGKQAALQSVSASTGGHAAALTTHSSQHKRLSRSCTYVQTALALCIANLEHVGVEASSNLLGSEVIQPRQLVEGGAHSHEGGAARPLPSLGSLTELYLKLFFHGY